MGFVGFGIAADVAFGGLQDFFVASSGDYAAFHTCHGSLPPKSSIRPLYVGHHPSYQSDVRCMHHSHGTQLTDTLGTLLGQNVTFEGMFTLEAVGGFLETLGRATVGFHLRHFLLRIVCTML